MAIVVDVKNNLMSFYRKVVSENLGGFKMNKIVRVFLVMALSIVLLSACGRNSAADKDKENGKPAFTVVTSFYPMYIATINITKDIPGVKLNRQPADPRYDANYWLCTMLLDPEVKVIGQENAYKEVIKTAVGGAAGVIHVVDSPTTDCQPNDNVEAMRVFMLSKKVECRPVWKPMHKQPVYVDAPVYTNGVEEDIFKVGMCLPAGPYVTDDDVKYIVDCIKEAILR